MREQRNAKWLTAGCGIICLATFLALNHDLPAKQAQRMVSRNVGSTGLGTNSAPRIAAALSNNIQSHASVVKHYGQLPLAFEPSRSASGAQSQFLARGNGYALFLANREAVLELRGASKTPSVLRMQLAGANPAPVFTAQEPLPGKSNYFIGNNPSEWRTNIPQYGRILEHDVYRGVNLAYYGTQGQLEYDFDVAPGIDPSVIRLAFQGAEGVTINAQGELVVNTNAGEVRMRKPVAYQEIAGAKQPVTVGYAVKDNSSVSFQVAKYDSSRTLVIDPILAYSTYLGGNNIDTSNAIAVAPDNTAFIAGGTFSTDFPTVHALQANDGGGPDFPQDAFVSKISADGSTLLYSTYLGGEAADTANGIAVDTFGNAYVTGTTSSPHFPHTPNVFGENCGYDAQCGATYNSGGLIITNAFVAKLNVAGSALVYSGFLGYYEYVQGNAIAVDANGNAYVTGRVGPNIPPTVTITPPNVPPPPFPNGNAIKAPTVVGGFNFGIPGVSNAYVTEISSTGASIVYSSYVGGSNEDAGTGIAVDATGNAYITGLAYSTDFPAVGALQTVNGGGGDAFLAKVNTTQTGSASLVYSTLLGGSGLDQGNGVAIDNAGNAYVAGLTKSLAGTLGFVPPAGGFQTNCVLDGSGTCEGDAFIAKLNTNATGAASLGYFTYLGGSKADQANGVAIDSTGNAYVTGTTVSTDFPTAGAVFQPAYGGGNADSFVAKINPAGAALVYSSYLGGTNTEQATGIAVDTSGSAYVTGQTCSQDFPLANPLEPVPAGNCEAYVAKVSILAGFALNPAGLVFPAQSLNTVSQSQTVTITNGDSAQTISGIAISGPNPGDFAETTTCGPSLAVGATCTVTVSFTPTASGIRKASLLITDSAPGSPQVVNLTGNTSTVTLSSSSLAFGFQQVGTPSASQPVTVTNSGTTPLTFSGITASGDFSETDNCTKASLQPNTNCVIQVTFTPTTAVASIGAITLTDNGSGSPQVILATGTGVLEPQASLSPASLGFTGQSVGITSAPQQVTLSNSGNAPLAIASIQPSGDFSQSNACGAILAANSSCAISVTFTPTLSGNRTGTLTITDNAQNIAGSVQTVPLSGLGIAVPVVSLSTSTLTFSNQAIGSLSASQPVTLTNTGNAALAISSVTPNGDFAETNNCSTSVAPGASCTINVTFVPLASGNLLGSITLVDNATNSPQTISMSGTGTGASFQVSSLTATPSVPAGQTATYSLSVLSIGGFSQQVALTCSAPSTMSCSISPSIVTPTTAVSHAATLTVTTALRTIAPPTSTFKINPFEMFRHFTSAWLMGMIALLMILTMALLRRRPITAAFGFAVLLLLVSTACGGGSAPGVPVGTPAGTYQVTVTATSGTTSSSIPVTLQVN